MLSVQESSELFTRLQELKIELENNPDYQTKQTKFQHTKNILII